MATLTQARRALADLLKAETKLQVTPNPPANTVLAKEIFFGAMTGTREAQGGADRTTVPVVLVLPANAEGVYDTLDEYIDGPKSIIDIIDANAELADGISVNVAGDGDEWSIELVKVAEIEHIGLRVDVELHY